MTTCYAEAENDNPGRSITVKVGGVTQYSGDDLDAVFDEVAEHHTSATLAITYNAAGRAALKHAMDCIFDHDYMTLSAVVLNRLDSNLEVRAYDVREFDSSQTLVGTYWFTALQPYGTGKVLTFNRNTSGDCISFSTTPLGTHDAERPLPDPPPTRCTDHDCDGDCSPNDSGDGSCDCSGDGGCAGVQKPGDTGGGNGTIVRITLE